MLYATTCEQCHGINGQGLTGSGGKLNGNPTVNNMSDNDLLRIISAGVVNPADPTKSAMPAFSQQYGGALTQDDIQYLFDLIRSSDPNYLSTNGYPSGPGTNGFNQVPKELQQSNLAGYQTAVAQATKGTGVASFPVVDMTNQKAIPIDMIDSTAGATCQPACYAVADPKNPGQEIISPNIKVKVGTVITWVNKSKTPHTVTSIVGENPASPVPAKVFDSGISNLLSTGKDFVYTVKADAFTFNSNHIVVYFCQVHPIMTAALTIVQ